MRNTRLWRLLAVLFAFALLATACGSDGDGGDDGTAAPAADPAPAPAADPAPAPDPEPAPAASGDDGAMESMEAPQLRFGYLQVAGASEAAQRLEQDAKVAIDMFGWEWVYCDAEGDVAQMQTCADSLIDQGVDVIVTDGTTVEVIVDQLARAQEEGIPFLNTGGTQSFYDQYAASFNPDDSNLGAILADWIVENGPGEGDIIVSSVGFTAWGAAREASLAAAIDGTGYSIGDTHDVDFADPVGQPADAVSTALTANPDAAVVWLTFDISALGVGPVITDLYPDSSPPDRPLVATFYANCTTQQQMLAGGVDVSVEENLEWSSWVAVDQIAAHFATGEPFSSELRPTYKDADGNELQFSQPFIVTPDTAPASCEPVVGPYPVPADASAAGFREFFSSKWADEYGL